MFDSLLKSIGDVATIVTKPIETAIDATRIVTKPAADAAKAVSDEVKSVVDDITKG